MLNRTDSGVGFKFGGRLTIRGVACKIGCCVLDLRQMNIYKLRITVNRFLSWHASVGMGEFLGLKKQI